MGHFSHFFLFFMKMLANTRNCELLIAINSTHNYTQFMNVEIYALKKRFFSFKNSIFSKLFFEIVEMLTHFLLWNLRRCASVDVRFENFSKPRVEVKFFIEAWATKKKLFFPPSQSRIHKLLEFSAVEKISNEWDAQFSVFNK